MPSYKLARRCVVVTGASGRLGRALCPLLLEAGWDVLGVDCNPGPFTCVTADICDYRSMEQVVAESSYIVHLAGLHYPHLLTAGEKEFFRVNVEGTMNVLELAARFGVKRMVFASTASLYGMAVRRHSGIVRITEDTPALPRDIYDDTKFHSERLCSEMDKKVNVTCLRLSRFFEEPEVLLNVHRQYRSISAKDAAMAHRLSLTSRTRGFEVINVGPIGPFSESRHISPSSIYDLPVGLAEYWRRSRSEGGPDFPDRVFSVSRLMRQFRWAPCFKVTNQAEIGLAPLRVPVAKNAKCRL